MSAEKLREAAALMRERAQAATSGAWIAEAVDGDVWDQGNRERICRTSSFAYHHDAEHIASWHPAVALAVADWLEGVGERHVPMGHPMYGVLCCATCNLDLEDDERGHCDDLADALAVARAYLGSDQ